MTSEPEDARVQHLALDRRHMRKFVAEHLVAATRDVVQSHGDLLCRRQACAAECPDRRNYGDPSVRVAMMSWRTVASSRGFPVRRCRSCRAAFGEILPSCRCSARCRLRHLRTS
jgi:hypothetical protein